LPQPHPFAACPCIHIADFLATIFDLSGETLAKQGLEKLAQQLL
jgi:hypothetical protein